jgi:hypothetical protein
MVGNSSLIPITEELPVRTTLWNSFAEVAA